MFKTVFNRTWLSPVTAVTFTAAAVTGLLMFLEVRAHILNCIHEWIGVAFAVVALFHLVLNWRAFMGYFRRPAALVSVAAGIGLCVAVAVIAVADDEHEGEHGPQPHHQRAE